MSIMKVQKPIMFDHEVITKLKQETNASQLVNSLVVAHYQKDSLRAKIARMTPEQVTRRLEILKKKEALEKQIEELENE